MEENKDKRPILGSSRVLEECERICSPQVLFTGSSFKVPQMAAFTERLFYCIFPCPVNSLYLHLCVGKYDCCCLAQGLSHLGFCSKWITYLLHVDHLQSSSPKELIFLPLAECLELLSMCVCVFV